MGIEKITGMYGRQCEMVVGHHLKGLKGRMHKRVESLTTYGGKGTQRELTRASRLGLGRKKRYRMPDEGM